MPSGQSRVYRVTQLRTGVHHREFAGTGSVVLKVVPVTGAAFSGTTMDRLICAFFFFHTHYCNEVGMLKVSEHVLVRCNKTVSEIVSEIVSETVSEIVSASVAEVVST